MELEGIKVEDPLHRVPESKGCDSKRGIGGGGVSHTHTLRHSEHDSVALTSASGEGTQPETLPTATGGPCLFLQGADAGAQVAASGLQLGAGVEAAPSGNRPHFHPSQFPA